jgi:hypothetical protein
MSNRMYEGVTAGGHRVKGAHYIEHITVIRGKCTETWRGERMTALRAMMG